MILVTGIANKISKTIVHQLVELGQEIKVFYRSAEDLKGIDTSSIQKFEGDILDVTDVYEAMQGVDMVIHCDTIEECIPVSYENRMKYNVEGTANMVNALLHHGGKRIIFLSSIHTLGSEPEKVITEETKSEKNEWTTDQALSFMLAEREIWRGSVEGLDVNIIHAAPFVDKDLNKYHLLQTAQNALASGKVAIYPSPIHYVGIEDVAQLIVQISQQEKWNQRWIAIAETIEAEKFYAVVAKHFSTSWKAKKTQSSSTYFKVVNDFIKSTLGLKVRTFRRANARRMMTPFQYDSSLTQKTFPIHWKKLPDLLS